MIDDTALASLQRSLGEYREAKRKTKTRLAEIEAESEMLRSQLSTIDAIIEQTELALRKVLFPADMWNDQSVNPPQIGRAQDARAQDAHAQFIQQSGSPYSQQANPQAGQQVNQQISHPAKQTVNYPSDAYDVASYRPSEAEIEAEVAKLQQNEQSSNIRFNDFRIPQAATIILREANSPLHVSEIYRQMAEGGFEFRGQHQLITLAVSLSRSKRFRKVAPGTFELNPEYQAGQVA